MDRGIAGPPAGTKGFSGRTSDPWIKKFWACTINNTKAFFQNYFFVACLLVVMKASQHWAISLGRRESALPKTELKREYSSWNWGLGICLLSVECYCKSLSVHKSLHWKKKKREREKKKKKERKKIMSLQYLDLCWKLGVLVCVWSRLCVILCVCCHSVCISVIWWIYLVSVIWQICLD